MSKLVENSFEVSSFNSFVFPFNGPSLEEGYKYSVGTLLASQVCEGQYEIRAIRYPLRRHQTLFLFTTTTNVHFGVHVAVALSPRHRNLHEDTRKRINGRWWWNALHKLRETMRAPYTPRDMASRTRVNYYCRILRHVIT